MKELETLSRRRFLQNGSVFVGASALAMFASAESAGLNEPPLIAGKSGLRILNDRPLNAEALPHLLVDAVTPTRHMFIRNNGVPPVGVDPSGWRLNIGGESIIRPLRLSIKDLRSRYQNVSLQLTLECGGNGRAEFDPSVPGNQWTLGAVGCPLWHGVRVRDVLEDAGLKNDAVYLAFHGADTHLSGDPEKEVISRGVPIEKAMADDALIAWGMNDGDLHPMNGHPLRLVIAGWPASASGKWLTGLSVRNQVHDGAKMGGQSYRVPKNPVAPGSVVDDSSMKIIGAMPVKSLLSVPQTGVRHDRGQQLKVSGHAWVGDAQVVSVDLSTDFGQTWQRASLQVPANVGAWQQFSAALVFPAVGYYEIWSRATDSNGLSQPMVLPGWNPKGYLNNACHRIAVHVV